MWCPGRDYSYWIALDMIVPKVCCPYIAYFYQMALPIPIGCDALAMLIPIGLAAPCIAYAYSICRPCLPDSYWI